MSRAVRVPGRTKLVDNFGEVKPGEGRGSPDDARYVEIHISRVEEAVNDLLVAVTGHLSAATNMLGLEFIADRRHPKYPHQADLDRVCTATAKLLREHAGKAWKAMATVRERDPVLRAARGMTQEFSRILQQVRLGVDPSPALFIASRWQVCAWALVNGRSDDAVRMSALFDWKDAVAETARLMSGAEVTGKV